MIIHLVLWKMKPIADSRTGKENAEVLAQRLNALKDVMPFAVAIEAGVNFNTSNAACDAGLYTAFKTLEDLDTYQKHPAHVKIAEWISTVTEEKLVSDFKV